jgi:kynurenine formamidase
VAEDPDFLLSVDDIKRWESEHGPLPEGGWLLVRTGWDARSHSQEEYLNADATGPHTPGFAPDCAQWIAEESPVVGLGVETVGTDAGAAAGFEPMFPCHTLMHGAGKYGLTQLQNLAQLPPQGTLLIVCPLKITGGSGSPSRVLAVVER